MDMPYHLRTLPPEALDILRFYRRLNARSAHAEDIIEGADLSDRGFGKAIRRLVTKNYLVMDGEQVYRLSDMGQRAVEELSGYDQNPAEDSYAYLEADADASADAEEESEMVSSYEPRQIRRRLVLVTPRRLRAGQPTNVYVGFDAAEDDEYLFSPQEVMLRLNVVHGEPQEATVTSLVLENRAVHQTIEVTAGDHQQARIRVEVCQFDGDTLDAEACGGLYADLPVSDDTVDATLTAFGADLMLREDAPSQDDLGFDQYDFE